MRAAILLFAAGLLDADGLSSAASGCSGCGKPQRTPVSADIPEPLQQPEPELDLVDTARIAPFSDAPSSTLRTLGLTGTDLGVSFERHGKLYFLFGDSWPYEGAQGNVDTIAMVDDTTWPPTGAPAPRWLTNGPRALGLAVSGVDLGGMNVPIEAVPNGDDTYVFFDAGFDESWKRHEESVLARAPNDDFAHLQLVHRHASERFINLSVVEYDGELWIFGSGKYRQSAVYLAHVAAARLGDRNAWRYVRTNAPDTADEREASQVANDACVGELSVRYVPALARFVMTYNCGSPRGIVMRTATHPAGPWTRGIVIFDPALHGYGKFMHQANVADGLSEPGREDEWAGEYGPYLVPSWAGIESDGTVSLVYLLSSWNPYQAHLVRSRLRRR